MNTLLWFHNDLRIHDNEALLHAAKYSDRLFCVFCIDPQWFKNGQFDTYLERLSKMSDSDFADAELMKSVNEEFDIYQE